VGFGRRLVDAEIGERARAVLEFCQRELDVLGPDVLWRIRRASRKVSSSTLRAYWSTGMSGRPAVPVIGKLMAAHKLPDVTVVGDAGMIS
jgi:hypothetical protein